MPTRVKLYPIVAGAAAATSADITSLRWTVSNKITQHCHRLFPWAKKTRKGERGTWRKARWQQHGGGAALVAAAADCLECGAHMLRTMRTHWYTEALIRILDLCKWEDSTDDTRVPEKYEASHLTHQYKICSLKFCYMFCWKSQHRNLWSRFKLIARSHDKPDNSQWLELTTDNCSDM